MANEISVLEHVELPAIATGGDIYEAWLDGLNKSTKRAYAVDLRAFSRFLKAPTENAAAARLMSLTAGEANGVALAYLTHMKDAGLTTKTILRRLSSLRSLTKLGRTLGRITWMIEIKGPKVEPYRDTRGPGLEGWQAVHAKAMDLAVDAVGKRNLALIRLMRIRGLRRGALVTLDIKHVHLRKNGPGRLDVLNKGKTDRESITIPTKTADAIRDWIAARGSAPGPLFIRLDPARDDSRLERLSGDNMCKMVKRLGELAGVEDPVRPHGLRHEAITRVLDITGGNLRIAQRFSGHAEYETLKHYDDNRQDFGGQAAARLEDD
jgi:integrase/recombinase XerC